MSPRQTFRTRMTAWSLCAAIVAGPACKKKDPEPEAGAAPPAVPVAGEDPNWKALCAGDPADLPFSESPLLARVGGKDVPVEVEIGRGGVIFSGPDLRLVVPAGGTPWNDVRVDHWLDHLVGRREAPVLRGQLPGHDGPPVLDALRLDLDPMVGGTVKGRIVLCLEAPADSVLAGTFTARVAENLSDAPDPTRDHSSALAYVAEVALGRKELAPRKAKFVHRGTRIDAAAGVGYDHVVVRGAERSAHTFTFKKDGDGAWIVDRRLPGDQIPEARPGSPPTTPDDVVLTEVARRVEEILQRRRKGATFRSRISPSLQGKSGTINVGVATDPQAGGEGDKPESIEIVAHVSRADDGPWNIDRLESKTPGLVPAASPPPDAGEK